VAVDLSFYKSYISEEIRDEGRAQGRAEDILVVLEQRGLDVSDDVRSRITDCTDPDVLRRWLIHAVTATKAEEIFEDE
jgi:Flp pilus assembly CpaE family ATPase